MDEVVITTHKPKFQTRIGSRRAQLQDNQKDDLIRNSGAEIISRTERQLQLSFFS